MQLHTTKKILMTICYKYQSVLQVSNKLSHRSSFIFRYNFPLRKNSKMQVVFVLSLCFKLLMLFYEVSDASDTINSSSSIIDNGTTLVSKDGTFELGFFTPSSLKNRYVGIWYKNIPVRTVVWVANRINPFNDSSGMLMINSRGQFVLMSQNKTEIWSANMTREAQGSVVLQLLDSGNLVLRDEQLGSYLWQSFDYPSDTLLPEMKLGLDIKTGLNRKLTAWKSWDDPSPGDFTFGYRLQDNPERIMWKGSKKFCRTGPWNGIRFGYPDLRPNPIYDFKYVFSEDELYFSYYLKNNSVLSRVVMNQTRYIRERFIWSEASQSWTVYSFVPRDHCDSYGLCGAYGTCITTQSPICQCLEGFKPISPGYADWSQGCKRNKPLNYSKLDGFIKFDGMKLPDATHSQVNASMNLRQCREKCLENSTCMAYTNSDIREGGSGCAMWFGDLMDIRQFPDGGLDLYVRMSASETGNKHTHTTQIFLIVVSTMGVVVVTLIAGYYIHKRKLNSGKNVQEMEDLELPLFELVTISRATNNFSYDNLLGEGGYGPVYKGTLENGLEIAVKRLSQISGQGLPEFKNEVILIVKLQHRNLVKLLGCCIQGEEKILIYEYMANKSLNHFIFDQTRSNKLDWPKRFQIICGIARGLLYLHQDSRLRIIHRDLKLSNILLDHELNPKISDFGLARICSGDQAAENTNRVVGTYGYMAPEYAIDGIFSTKSDTFSFGILLLELISGKKRRGFSHSEHNLSLIGHAWKMWKEGRPLELIDPVIRESCNESEVVRSIHISLLCMEHRPEDRPSMSSVVFMLECETTMPQPKQPGFLMDKGMLESDSSSKPDSSSSNKITITLLEAR